ncbi:hypothetical protein IWQ48_001080 [Labrenzia sp. EL_13]|nr:hypothetical protein [Labrenzia sp. EL_13]
MFSLGVFITILTVISSIAAFFYKTDGEYNQIGGFGYFLLLLLATIGGANIYSSFVSASNKVEANLKQQELENENARLNYENRLANSAIQLRYLELEEPFSHAILAFSSFDSAELYPEHVPNPLGENFVILPQQIPDNAEVKVWIDIFDFLALGAAFKSDGAGEIDVQQGITSEIEPKLSYKLNPGEFCDMALDPGCKSKPRAFYFEALAAIDGDSHFLIELQKALKTPALETASRIMQSKYIGGAVIPVELTRKTRKKFENYFKNHINSHFYFVQDYPAGSALKNCKRTVRLPVNISVVTQFPGEVGNVCPRKSLCLLFEHTSNFSVNSCQISEI